MIDTKIRCAINKTCFPFMMVESLNRLWYVEKKTAVQNRFEGTFSIVKYLAQYIESHLKAIKKKTENMRVN